METGPVNGLLPGRSCRLSLAVAGRQVADLGFRRVGYITGHVTGHVYSALGFLRELVGRTGNVIDAGVGEALGSEDATESPQDARGRRALRQAVDKQAGTRADQKSSP